MKETVLRQFNVLLTGINLELHKSFDDLFPAEKQIS